MPEIHQDAPHAVLPSITSLITIILLLASIAKSKFLTETSRESSIESHVFSG